MKEVRDELKGSPRACATAPPPSSPPFVNVHLMLLEDDAFSEAPREIIREQRCNAEWALRTQLDELTAQFDDIQDEYLREREATCARWPSASSRRWPAPSACWR